MKKIILMAFATSIITLGTQAQVNRKFDSTQNMQKRMKRANTEGMNFQALNLTAEQKLQMKKNQEDFKAQREAVRNDASLAPEQKKAKMQEIQKSSREKTNSLLTADQKTTLEANRKDYGGKDKDKAMTKGKGMKDMKGMKGMNGMKDMNFTADQKAKMQIMRTDMKSEMDKIKSNTSLTQDKKKEQMSNVQKKYKDQMGQILTPEQKLKMKDQQGKIKNNRMKRNQ